MLTFANVLNFLTNELTGLRRRRLTFLRIATRTLNHIFFWHVPIPFGERTDGRVGNGQLNRAARPRNRARLCWSVAPL